VCIRWVFLSFLLPLLCSFLLSGNSLTREARREKEREAEKEKERTKTNRHSQTAKGSLSTVLIQVIR